MKTIDEQSYPCNSRCPKCGSLDVCRRHMEAGDTRPMYGSKRRSNEYLEVEIIVIKALKEHIGHHCRCCQYEWEEPTLERKTREIGREMVKRLQVAISPTEQA